MKQAKITKKLSFNKLTVSNLNVTKGAAADAEAPDTDICVITRTCLNTNCTCYAYSCPGWTNCAAGYAC